MQKVRDHDREVRQFRLRCTLPQGNDDPCQVRLPRCGRQVISGLLKDSVHTQSTPNQANKGRLRKLLKLVLNDNLTKRLKLSVNIQNNHLSDQINIGLKIMRPSLKK